MANTVATDQGAIYIRSAKSAVRKINLKLPSATIPPNQAEDPLILTIDIGTTSIRTALFDRLGRAVEGSEVRQAHKIRSRLAKALPKQTPTFCCNGSLAAWTG